MKKTTAEIIFFCATDQGDPQGCVDWALEALSEGYDSPTLRILAGLSQPLNFFEVKDWTVLALSELGITIPSVPQAVLAYASELIQEIIGNPEQGEECLKTLSELAMFDLPSKHGLYDFYLLYNAYSDLQHENVQFYWLGADRSNIDTIIRSRCLDWLMEYTDPSV